MIAETIWDVAKKLYDVITHRNEAQLQRTIRVADYFAGLAQIIEDTSAFLKKGQYRMALPLVLHGFTAISPVSRRVVRRELRRAVC